MTWTPPHPGLVPLMDEVLRWNRSFSLISRQKTETRCRELVAECWSSFRVLTPTLARLATGAPITYFDLGTGGGFPGLIWSLALKEKAPPLPGHGAHLVEPRQKRAWFLGRCAALMGLGGVEIHEMSWAPGCWHESTEGGGLVLVSLKALAMTDQAILEGFVEPRRPVLIARFLGGHESAQAEFLGLPDHNTETLVGAEVPCWAALPYEFFGREDALVLSYYPLTT